MDFWGNVDAFDATSVWIFSIIRFFGVSEDDDHRDNSQNAQDCIHFLLYTFIFFWDRKLLFCVVVW